MGTKILTPPPPNNFFLMQMFAVFWLFEVFGDLGVFRIVWDCLDCLLYFGVFVVFGLCLENIESVLLIHCRGAF